MKLDDVIEHCRRLKHTAEDVKWGSVLAFSIGGKMYCCLSLDEKFGVSFKCSPGNFLALTDLPGIIPAPYLAKYHWVKSTTPRALPKKELLRLIAESQRIVQNGLPRKIKQTITQPGQPEPYGRSQKSKSASRCCGTKTQSYRKVFSFAFLCVTQTGVALAASRLCVNAFK